MNLQDTLYFPGTAIVSGSRYQIFLLFPAVHLLQPVEPEEGAGDPAESADLFINHGFCQAHTPCPLGPDRRRFLRLVEDIGSRRDDYAAQLSALTVASLSAPRQQGEETPQAIVSSLLGSPDRRQDTSDDAGQALWQARLVLKIAELLDREEEEIARELALLEESEHELFLRLHGEGADADLTPDEDDNPLAELLGIQARVRPQSATTIGKRLRAWERLLASGPLPEWRVWTTHWPDAADIVIERSVQLAGGQATRTATLPLPATVGATAEEACAAIVAFRKDHAALAAEVVKALPHALTAELSGRWQSAIDGHFPDRRFGRTTATVYHLPHKGVPALLGLTGEEGSGTVLLSIADPA